jgi:hypothetical protein
VPANNVVRRDSTALAILSCMVSPRPFLPC